jgi:phage shock protein A
MVYFSRLTDIVTCSLTEILANEEDPQAALDQILSEMSEGLAGAQRSVKTATRNEKRISSELTEHKSQIDHWLQKAKESLAAGNENEARLALLRKKEVEDQIAGLQQQLDAATATKNHMQTTLRALEARVADAKRRKRELENGDSAKDTGPASAIGSSDSATSTVSERVQEVEDELADLKKQLEQGS